MKQKIFVPKRNIIRASVRDAMTFDAAYNQVIDGQGTHRGKQFEQTFTTRDGRTVDSTGAFMVGELERLDLNLHKPLAAVTWGRDIDLREDVTIGDDASSFTVSSFASSGGLGQGQAIGNGKSWIGRKANQVPSTTVDIAKISNPLTPWGNELHYTIFELEAAARLGRPIDQQKFEALQLKHQMDVDEQVYIGDTGLSLGGLCNHPLVSTYGTVASVAVGASASTRFALKTPDEILADFNTMLTTVWAASGYAVIAKDILLPPAQFGFLSTQKVSNAGNISILKYVMENNVYTQSEGKDISIKPLKWLAGSLDATLGTALANGAVDRAIVYTKDKDRVRFPMTPLNRTPVQFDSIFHKSTYFCKLGAVEVVYPETIGYFDGI
jgi:hypothetical protein